MRSPLAPNKIKGIHRLLGIELGKVIIYKVLNKIRWWFKVKYMVFTLDCIDSQRMNNVTSFLEERASQFNMDPFRKSLFITDVKVLIGDEIQGVIEYSSDFIKIIRYLREAFLPIKVRIGIGIGDIDNPENLEFRDPWKLNGTAFYRARESLKYLMDNAALRKRGLSLINSGDAKFDLMINNQLLMYDTLLERWSDKTYESISLKEQYGSFRKLDGLNSISASAYTKRANAGNWVIIDRFETTLKQIIEAY